MIQLREALDGRHYFNVKANNNEIVSTSQMYDFPSGAKSGAEALLKATADYWKVSFATLIEEWNEANFENSAEGISVPAIVSRLLSLTNSDLQDIIERMPYEK